jgi:glycosyltransferase involved in cell wall biosynthesis
MMSSELVSGPEPELHARARVLHVLGGNLYGGVETFLRTLARSRAHAAPSTMDFALCFEGRLAGELREAGATLHMLGAARIRSRRSVQAARRALADALTAGRYDVVVCHAAWPHALFAPVVRQRGARLVHHMHDVPNRRGWLDHLAGRTPPDLVVCNSRFTEEAGRWLFPRARRIMVRYPLALGDRADRSVRARVRVRLGAADDAVVILHASRMQAWKGHALLVDALAQLRDHPRWVCWFAGGAQRPAEEEYLRRLRASIDRQGLTARVRFLGQRSDVPELMAAADVHCQPNLGPEPFGIVFVEALAAGLPIVTTAMGGPLEILTDSCGKLVERDARAVAVALAALIDDDAARADLSRGGPPRARALCDAAARTRELTRELASLAAPEPPVDARARASLSAGQSGDPILSVVVDVARKLGGRFERVVDLGCGRGDCARRLEGMYRSYVGGDVVRYDQFPRSNDVRFVEVDLNRTPYPLEQACADLVLAVETIEHVENPRALVREMARVVRPGGWIIVTTPNQLSLMSKLYLVTRNQFHAFQRAPGLYPAHITALVEEDLRRIASETGLTDVEIRYTAQGRIPLTNRSWPRGLGARGRAFSDNVVLAARRP